MEILIKKSRNYFSYFSFDNLVVENIFKLTHVFFA